MHGWGANDRGQVGDGTTTDRTTPTRIGADTEGWSDVAAGGHHSVASRVGPSGDRFASGWGGNEWGQVGDGTTVDRLRPVALSADLLWDPVELDAGFGHTIARTSGNSIMAWGRNDRGQLGNGTTVDSPVPGPVTCGCPRILWQPIDAGGNHTIGLSTPLE